MTATITHDATMDDNNNHFNSQDDGYHENFICGFECPIKARVYATLLLLHLLPGVG